MVNGYRFRLAALAGAVALLAAGVACNSVLGIESATVEPGFGLVDGGTTSDGAAPPIVSSEACKAYCNLVVANCPNDEYNDVPTCLALCGAFDNGQVTDTKQDSLGCRAHYAALAATDTSNCPAAGPLGGGVCGDNLCNTFCALDTYACTGVNTVFDGGQIPCESACAQNFNTYVTDAGNDLALSTGNSLNCRIWHLEAAVGPGGATEIVTHCPHTAVVSAFCN